MIYKFFNQFNTTKTIYVLHLFFYLNFFDMKEIEFSKIKNHNIVTGTISCKEYFYQVKGGIYKPEVEEVRKYIKEGRVSDANQAKNKLPAITPNGVFEIRKDNTPPIKSSQLVALDIDKLSIQGIQVEDLREKLKNDPYVLAAHLSASGNGMVVWIYHKGTVKDHVYTVDQISDRFERLYDLKIDRKASKSINGLRYASYDPDLFVNWSAQQYHVIEPETYSAIKEQEKFTMKKESPEEGNRNNFLFQFACNCKRAGIDEEDFTSYAILNFEDKDFTSKEIKSTIKSGYRQKLENDSSKSKSKSNNFRRLKGSPLQMMIATEKYVQEIKASKIKDLQPIITYGGKPLIFPNTIVLLQGKHGSHKSRVAGSVASAILQKPGCGVVPLNLCVMKENMHVVYLDTERSLQAQFPLAIQQIQKCACIPIDVHPDNFSYSSLLDIPRSERFTALQEFVRHKRDLIGPDKHMVIILDVVSDLILSFNDATESLALVDFLNDLINTEDCTIITCLHENPSSTNEKARGHAGTELGNKASTIIQVTAMPNLENMIRVAVKKSRNTKLPEPIFAEYDEVQERLRVIDSSKIQEAKTVLVKADLNSVVEYIGQNLLKPKIRKEFFDDLTNHFNCGIRTIEPKISEIIIDQILIPTAVGDMELRKEKRSDGVYYFLNEPKKLESEATAA